MNGSEIIAALDKGCEPLCVRLTRKYDLGSDVLGVKNLGNRSRRLDHTYSPIPINEQKYQNTVMAAATTAARLLRLITAYDAVATSEPPTKMAQSNDGHCAIQMHEENGPN